MRRTSNDTSGQGASGQGASGHGASGQGASGQTGGAREQGLSAGRVGRPHGLDGSFYVTGARSRLLTLGTAVTIAGKTVPIVRRAGTDQRPIVRINGIQDRAGAQELHGLELIVAARDAPQLAEEEWWAHELEECEVLDGERRIGRVVRLIELPSCEALEVQRATQAQPLLVPMVSDAIRSIDVNARVIDVDMRFIEE
jgi:16S rRNA processing protein RimM